MEKWEERYESKRVAIVIDPNRIKSQEANSENNPTAKRSYFSARLISHKELESLLEEGWEILFFEIHKGSSKGTLEVEVNLSRQILELSPKDPDRVIEGYSKPVEEQ